MKSTKTLLYIMLLSFCLYSCNRHYPHTMQIVDPLANIQPDSTLALLDQLEESTNQEPESTRIYSHTIDSLIMTVLHYYEDKQDKKYIAIFIFTIIMMATLFFVYKQSQAYIEDNKRYIDQLGKELQAVKESNNQLKQDLLCLQKVALEKDSEQIEVRQKMEDKAVKALKKSVIYKKFQEAHDKMNEEEWKEFTGAINATYSQFTHRLKDLYPMTEVELRICLLDKIGLAPTQMAQVIVKSKQAITSIRKRLYKKIFKRNGTPDEWDNFIREF